MRRKAFCVLLFAGVLATAPVLAQDGEEAVGEAAPVPEDAAAAAPAEDEEITGSGVLVASLAGSGIPDGGDAAATGTFRVELDAGAGDYCYVLAVKGLRGAASAQLGEAPAGEKGSRVLELEVTGAGGDLCRGGDPEVLKRILDDPAAYYVQVASTAQPNGAIRGQLGRQ